MSLGDDNEAQARRNAFIEKAAFASASAATASAAKNGSRPVSRRSEQSVPQRKSKGLVIDCEHHIKNFGISAVTAQQSIEWMDRNGVDMALATTHVRTSSPLRVVQEDNDILAKMVSDHPDRYIGCATVPIDAQGKPDLVEVERCVKELGLHSVYIATRPGDPGPLHLDSREMWPFYEKITELNIPVKVEITNFGTGYNELLQPEFQLAYPLHMILAREFDMAAAVLRLCLGGVMEEFPDVTFLMDHYGGSVAALMDRVDQVWEGYEPHIKVPFYFDKPLITKPWREYFNRLYFGLAGRGHSVDTLKMLLVNIDPSKIMFASDWPYVGHNDQIGTDMINNILDMDLTQEEVDGILGENAYRVFGSANLPERLRSSNQQPVAAQ